MYKKVVSFKIKKKYFLAITIVVVPLLIITLPLLVFLIAFQGRIYPGITIENINVAGLSALEAQELLFDQYPGFNTINITLKSAAKSQSFTVPSNSVGAKVEYEKAVQNAFKIGRSGRRVKDIFDTISTLLYKREVKLNTYVDKNSLYEQVSVIASQTLDPPTKPTLRLVDGNVVISEGTEGYILDINKSISQIIFALNSGSNNILLEADFYHSMLSQEQIDTLLSRGQNIKDKKLIFTFEDNVKFDYSGEKLIELLDVNRYNLEKLSPSFEDIARTIERDPENPLFVFEESKVKEFKPAQKGVSLNRGAMESEFVRTLSELENSDINELISQVPVIYKDSEIQTSEVNNLGIKELIGVGTSNFRGSISTRVYNVAHAAGKLNGVLIKPGETFSFVNTLGDISALTGYKQAYIIQGNETILGDGGGVCQVSTTFFRAALNAGLPIVERHAHSYRVGYYEQGSPPGIDATIYHPTVDIKIKNDTPAHVLIQTKVDTKNMTLRFEFYGTSDGRVAEITKPVVSKVTPPPEDLYVDDPTLPAGQIKQIDYKAWGAKVNFKYSVIRNGETIFEDTYFSNYKPWQAKFLRGTGPAI